MDFKINSDSSLIELIFTSGAFAAVLLVILLFLIVQKKYPTNSEAKRESLELRQTIKEVLQNEVACTHTFYGKEIGPEISQIRNSYDQIILERGESYGRHLLKLESMRTVDRNWPLNSNYRLVNFVLTFRNVDFLYFATTFSIVIPLKVGFDSSKRIILSCQSTGH